MGIKRHSIARSFTATIQRGGLLLALLLTLFAGVSQTSWRAAAQQNAPASVTDELAGPAVPLAQAQNLVEVEEAQKTPDGWQALMMSGNFLVDRLTDNNPGGGGEGAGFVGDLRYCITQANALGGNNTIDFSVIGTINLAGALPNLNNNLTINGLGAHVLTVRRNTGGDYRLFRVNTGKTVNIAGLTITNGQVLSGDGGGIRTEVGSTLNLSSCIVTGNVGKSFGGGVAVYGAATINECTISNNQSGSGGGLISAFNTLTLSNSTIRNNQANFHGGIYVQDGTATISNCTVSGNTAVTSSSGIFNRGIFLPSSTTIINCTVTGNSSPGTAILTGSNGTAAATFVKNTLVAANSTKNYAIGGGPTSMTSLGHNLDTDGTSGFVNGLNGDIIGSLGAPINAQLGPLAFNGGATETHALLCGSPAIDAGDNNGAPTKDQRGVVRPLGSLVDIGAFESTQICLSSLPHGQAGVPYNQTIAVNGCNAPYSFSLMQGNLPPGFTLNAATGVVSGLATVVGAYNFTVKVTAGMGCEGTRSYVLTIACPTVTVNPVTLPSGTVGVAYNQMVSGAPAGGNYSYAVIGGALPPGLALNAATGAITGTPTMAGQFGVVIQATGFGACTGTRSYTLTIAGQACPAITLGNLANGSTSQFYYGVVAASPAGSYSYAVTNGALPPGLVLHNLTGAIYGTLTQAGTFNFTLTATNASACTGSKAYSVAITQ